MHRDRYQKNQNLESTTAIHVNSFSIFTLLDEFFLMRIVNMNTNENVR